MFENTEGIYQNSLAYNHVIDCPFLKNLNPLNQITPKHRPRIGVFNTVKSTTNINAGKTSSMGLHSNVVGSSSVLQIKYFELFDIISPYPMTLKAAYVAVIMIGMETKLITFLLL